MCAGTADGIHLLTEDIEFSIVNAIEGEKIGYCGTAVLYDEQPETFRQSWTQRMRWSKGFYQVNWKYGKALITNLFHKKENTFACYDMLMTIAPASLVSLTCLAMNLAFLVTALLQPHYVNTMVVLAGKSVLFAFVNFYVILFAMGVLTTITEWKQIKAPAYKKVLYTFTFPVFISLPMFPSRLLHCSKMWAVDTDYFHSVAKIGAGDEITGFPIKIKGTKENFLFRPFFAPLTGCRYVHR